MDLTAHAQKMASMGPVSCDTGKSSYAMCSDFKLLKAFSSTFQKALSLDARGALDRPDRHEKLRDCKRFERCRDLIHHRTTRYRLGTVSPRIHVNLFGCRRTKEYAVNHILLPFSNNCGNPLGGCIRPPN